MLTEEIEYANNNKPGHVPGMTALTDAEWMQLAAKRRGADYVVLVDGKQIAQTNWLTALGHWFLNTKAGERVVMVAAADHQDYVRRVAEAALVSL